MPTYTMINKKTKKTKEMFMGISEMETWAKKNPGWEVMCGTPGFHSGMGLGVRRNDDGWKDVLKSVKKGHRRSTINTHGVG